MIPNFDNEALPKGVHPCTGKEFIERFCKGEIRKSFIPVIINILDYAQDLGSSRIFIGGSFVKNTETPSDLDVVITVSQFSHIQLWRENVMIENVSADIMFCLEHETEVVNSFIRLLSSDQIGREFGIVEIQLSSNQSAWQQRHPTDSSLYEIIKTAYLNKPARIIKPKGILALIHGVNTHARWFDQVSTVASSQGWIVAPFYHGHHNPAILLCPRKRKAVLNMFRAWLHSVRDKYSYKMNVDNFSVISHSFGTWLIASYLEGFDPKLPPPVEFDSIITTGSILNCDLDWTKHLGKSVARIRNERSLDDRYVPLMKWIRWIDPLYGTAGVDGFNCQHPHILQYEHKILNHENIIESDMIENFWMPFLNSNAGILNIEKINKNFYSKP